MNNLNTGTRLGTMILDHFIMVFVVAIFAVPGMIVDMANSFNSPIPEPKLFIGNYYLNILAFSLYFNKDIFLGKSPAKRILKLQVVNYKTGLPANSIRCLLRNFTIILWPIEVIAGLINHERRIGDYIAGTKLTTYDSEDHKTKPNWLYIFIAVLASILVTYLVMFYPLEVLFPL